MPSSCRRSSMPISILLGSVAATLLSDRPAGGCFNRPPTAPILEVMAPGSLVRVAAMLALLASASCGGDGDGADASPTPPVPLPSPATTVTEGDLATFAYGTLDSPSVFSGLVAI